MFKKGGLEIYEKCCAVWIKRAKPKTPVARAVQEHQEMTEVSDRLRNTFYSIQDPLRRDENRDVSVRWLQDISIATASYLNNID